MGNVFNDGYVFEFLVNAHFPNDVIFKDKRK